MVLGKLPVPGHPTNLGYSRAKGYCTCSRCGWGLFGHFFSRLSLLFSFSLSFQKIVILVSQKKKKKKKKSKICISA